MKKTHKIGKNDQCPCGSGKKYKKCCLPLNEQLKSELEELDSDEYIHICAFCGKVILDDHEVFSLNAKLRPGVDLREFAGKIIKLPSLSMEILPAVVPGLDSDAKKAGNDLLFCLCSRDCGEDLRTTLELEKNIFSGFKSSS
ncbi:MAG: SEC-C domain-containing protein [Candidatus Marinimicrobia bacterium]|nr:SEC-C domain-containing protein [Candidatus Neomarinimicrobiota bacterium]